MFLFVWNHSSYFCGVSPTLILLEGMLVSSRNVGSPSLSSRNCLDSKSLCAVWPRNLNPRNTSKAIFPPAASRRGESEMSLQGEGGTCLGSSSSCDHASPDLNPHSPQPILPSEVLARILQQGSVTSTVKQTVLCSFPKMSRVSYMSIFLSVQSLAGNVLSSLWLCFKLLASLISWQP